jgi:Skp family chaperone for outer membrane proteins
MRTPLALALAVAAFCTQAANAQPQQAPPRQGQSPPRQPQQAPAPRGGTALVDMSVITKHAARFNQAMEQLKAEYTAKAEELRKEGERGNQLTEKLRAMPSGSPERKQLEQDILKMRADFELNGKRVTDRIRDSETQIILGLIQDLRGEMERYARANNVKLILRHDPTPPELTDPRMILQEIHKPIVYQRGSDVTPAILEALNRRGPAAGVPATGRAPVSNRTAPR